MSRGLARAARRRAKRASRGAQTGLILVSLIDIFTTLVVYLLYSSTGVETLSNPETISLPESVASQKAHEAHVVMVTRQDVIFGEQKIISVAEVEKSDTPVLAPLVAEFQQLSLKKNEKGIESRGEVNILADRDTPYSVIKRVMATCAAAKFERISLAVNERGGRQ
jgi:biopolymer transport protein ExbD